MSARRRVRAYGPSASIIECSSIDEVHALTTYARSTFAGELIDVVPGATTVTVVGHKPLPAEAVEALATATLDASGPSMGTTHTIDVVYDGEDLGWVADHLGLSQSALVAAHTGQLWTVAFCGFAPGFGYLAGDPTVALDVPRLERPRPSVPAGSVALAGPWSAVYPRASPGGWRLIGRTDAVLWSDDVDRPALLAPGDRVQFREVRR